MKILLCILLCPLSGLLFAQKSGTIPPIIRAQTTLDDMSRGPIGSNTVLYGIPIREPNLIGDFYIDEKWNVTTVLLRNDKLIENCQARFDLKSNILEVKVDNRTIKALDLEKIKSIVWLDAVTSNPRYFISAKGYKVEGTELVGLLEVLSDGDTPLFEHIVVSIKRADYNIALDVGSKDDKVIKKEMLYYGRNNELIKVSGKRSLESAFGERFKMVESFAKEKGLSFGKSSHLVHIFDYFNSL